MSSQYTLLRPLIFLPHLISVHPFGLGAHSCRVADILIAIGPFVLGLWGLPALAETPMHAGLAMQTIFSPSRAPENKTMGLTQLSFLDLLEDGNGAMELALVMDGTESMGENLQSFKESFPLMWNDLSRYRPGDVHVQLVVYRDLAAPLEVEFPLKGDGNKFTSDVALLKKVVGELQSGSGAPYFHELIDLGVYEALTKLEWSKDPKVTKWLMVFGDAPPFEQDFQEGEVRRRVATEQLVALASAKGIKINCILCQSREKDLPTHRQVVDRLRQFMSELSVGTGGLALDCSYSEVQKAIEKAAKTPLQEHVRIAPITEDDISRTADERTKDNRPLRVAVIPHLPLGKMNFLSTLPQVHYANRMQMLLERMPGIQVESMSEVQRSFGYMNLNQGSDSAHLANLGEMLNADYLIWGDVNKQASTLTASTGIYEGVTGRLLGKRQNSSGVSEGELTENVLLSLIGQDLAKPSALIKRLAAASEKLKTKSGDFSPLARSKKLEDDLINAYSLLETALDPTQQQDVENNQQEALNILKRIVSPENEPKNAVAHHLLANCYFSQARSLLHKGDAQGASEAREKYLTELGLAFQHLDQVASKSVRTEIEADYQLMVEQNYDKAIKLYETLAGMNSQADPKTQPPVLENSALRAHWMLAGIRGGDWEAGKEFQDDGKVREHIVQILAHWPDSAQSRFLKMRLRWNNLEGKTEFPYVPLEKTVLAQN